jgi:hypothetical protein
VGWRVDKDPVGKSQIVDQSIAGSRQVEIRGRALPSHALALVQYEGLYRD